MQNAECKIDNPSVGNADSSLYTREPMKCKMQNAELNVKTESVALPYSPFVLLFNQEALDFTSRCLFKWLISDFKLINVLVCNKLLVDFCYLFVKRVIDSLFSA